MMLGHHDPNIQKNNEYQINKYPPRTVISKTTLRNRDTRHPDEKQHKLFDKSCGPIRMQDVRYDQMNRFDHGLQTLTEYHGALKDQAQQT